MQTERKIGMTFLENNLAVCSKTFTQQFVYELILIKTTQLCKYELKDVLHASYDIKTLEIP